MESVTTSREAPARYVGSVSTDGTPAQFYAAAYNALAAVGALAVVGWWWLDTPSVTGLGGWLTNAGRVTGLLAGYLIPLLLLVMGRVRWLERQVGTDRLARWHAHLGRYTISLIVAHTLLIIWGYAVVDHQGLASQTSSLMLSYPDVLMATVGAGLFVGIAYVSARKVRRRLAYETWYYLHLYTYLAVALSFAHVFATGAEFASHRGARVLWSAFYLWAVGTVAWYRFAQPIYRFFHHRVAVERVVKEGPQIYSVILHGHHLTELPIEAGQFVRLRFLARGHWWSSHPYSLSAPPAGNRLRVTVKALGDHSAGVAALKRGTRVSMEGPYGALTGARRSRRKVLLLAGGIGITPMRALFESLPAGDSEITLVYRAERDGDVVFAPELNSLANRRGQNVHYLIGPIGGERDVLVGRRLTGLVPDLAEHDVYLAGPPGFVHAAEACLQRLGLPRWQVHAENFAL